MKTYFLSFMTLFFIFSLSACSNDDDNQPIQPNDHPIVGKWSLISARIDWTDPHTFNQGDIIWEFNDDEVLININIDDNNLTPILYPFHVSGENANYEINNNESQITFFIDYLQDGQTNNYAYPYEIISDTLKIGFESSSTGGVSLRTFVRM